MTADEFVRSFLEGRRSFVDLIVFGDVPLEFDDLYRFKGTFELRRITFAGNVTMKNLLASPGRYVFDHLHVDGVLTISNVN